MSIVSFGQDTGPHSVHLTHDDQRLVVTDYFLNEDDFGKIHVEGDHMVHVLNVSDDGLTVDPTVHVIPSEARDLHFAFKCRSLASLGMTECD